MSGETLHELALRYGLPVCDLDGFYPQGEAIAVVPLSLALRLKIVPLSKVGCVITIVISNPIDIPVVDAVRFHTGLRVECVVATVEDIEAAIPRFYNVAEVEEVEVVEQYTPRAAAFFLSRADALVQAALATPHVRRTPSHRTSSLHHRAFYVGSLENQPSYEQVIAAATRKEGK